MKIKGLPQAQSFRASALARILGVDAKTAKLLKLGQEVDVQTAPPAEYDGTVFIFSSVEKIDKDDKKITKRSEA